MTKTFNTFVENFSFVVKGMSLLLKLVAKKSDAKNNYNVIDTFRLIEQVIDVASAFIENRLQPFFSRQNRLSNFILRYFSPFRSDCVL